MIYLDNNATTFLTPAVRARIEALMANPIGNPSSPYRLGAEARSELEQARDRVADALGTRADCVLFVASGSEANAMALAAAQCCEQQRDEILVSEVEHSSVAANATLLDGRGYTVRYVPVDRNGRIDLDQLVEMLGVRTAIVSVQWVNNETGVIQPVEKVATLCRNAGALYHCDAAQAFGKIPIDLDGSSWSRSDHRHRPQDQRAPPASAPCTPAIRRCCSRWWVAATKNRASAAAPRT